MPERAGAGRHGTALVSFFLALFGIGLALDAAFGAWHRSLGPSHRNPLFRRAWSEHVRGAEPKREGEKLIVLITNSQGYGREVSDAQTYPALLEGLLRMREQRPVRLLNWALPGGSAPEFTLLCAAVHRLRPDLVLLLSNPTNFSAALLRPLEGGLVRQPWSSDTPHLLAFEDVRQRVTSDFIERYFDTPERFDQRVSAAVRPWRYRSLPVAWSMRFEALRPFERYPATETWFFGAIRHPDRIMTIRPRAPVSWKLVDEVVQALGRPSFRTVFVDIPRHSVQGEQQAGFHDGVRERFEAIGGSALDLSRALPDEHFQTATHLTAAGHARLAAILADRLLP